MQMRRVTREMILRRTVAQLHWWPLLSAATLLFLLGQTVGDDFDERLGGAAYPAVEYVAEKPSKTYNIPLELNEEPFMLVEWSTEASRLRHGFQFILPPGILLVASLAAAALLFVWSARANAPFPFFKKGRNQGGGAEVSVESEDLDSLHESHYTNAVDSSLVLQSVLRTISADLGRAIGAALEKRSAALGLLNSPSASDSMSPVVDEVVPLLLGATDKLAAPAKGIDHAIDALQRPLSDSQATSRLDSVLDEMQTCILDPFRDPKLQMDMETVRMRLELGEGPMAEPTQQPDDQPAAPGEGIPMVGPPDAGEAEKELQGVMAKLSDWLKALYDVRLLLLEAVPAVSKAVDDVRAAYELV